MYISNKQVLIQNFSLYNKIYPFISVSSPSGRLLFLTPFLPHFQSQIFLKIIQIK